MRRSIKTGLNFGSTSGIITTLGLIIGLHSGTHSKLAILGGILTIAVADAFSDAMGIHVSEEANKRNTREVWESTLFTFLAKFVFALTFVVPMILPVELLTSIIISVVWGLLLLSIFSYRLAKENESKMPFEVVAEHLLIAVLVIFTTHFVGEMIAAVFPSL